MLEASFRPTYEGELPFMDVMRMMEERGDRVERSLSCLAVPRSDRIVEMDAALVRTVSDKGLVAECCRV